MLPDVRVTNSVTELYGFVSHFLCVPFTSGWSHVPRRTPTGLSPEYVNFNLGSGKVRRRLMDLSIALFKKISQAKT